MPKQFAYLLLFIIPFLSGFALWYYKPKMINFLEVLLSFSGAFLLTLCIVHLLPELYESHNSKVGIFILLGFLLQLILDFFSKGVEHGHFHIDSDGILSFPIAIFISLCLHSLFEGMALTNPNPGVIHSYLSAGQNSILAGLIIHKIPITLILTTLLIKAKIKKRTLFFALILFCLCSPLGFFLSNYFEQHALSSILNFNIFLALSIGIFLHISTTLLIESGHAHKFNIRNFIAIISGIVIAYLSIM